jgi:hypothetical protein
MEEVPPREGGKYMLLTYVIALTIVITLLFGAVYAHFFFGQHRLRSTKKKAEVRVLHVARTPHLHDCIFSTYP